MFIIKGNHFIDCPFLVVKGCFVNNTILQEAA